MNPWLAVAIILGITLGGVLFFMLLAYTIDTVTALIELNRIKHEKGTRYDSDGAKRDHRD